MVERILELLNERNISEYRLIKDCGLPNSSITQWKQGKAQPGISAIIKIAKYLNVSTDYLLGLENDKTKNINTNTNTNNNQSNATGGNNTNNINFSSLLQKNSDNDKTTDELPFDGNIWGAMWQSVKDMADNITDPVHKKRVLHNEYLRLLEVYQEITTGKKKKRK